MLYPHPIKDYKRLDRVGFVSWVLSPEIQFSKRSQVHNDLLILINCNVLDVFQSGMARSAYAKMEKIPANQKLIKFTRGEYKAFQTHCFWR